MEVLKVTRREELLRELANTEAFLADDDGFFKALTHSALKEREMILKQIAEMDEWERVQK